MDWIEIDGSAGEGGGQILRTALSLSMITGRPFALERIRAKRSRPGLLRQHLTAVQAAAAICGAEVRGAELGSQSLRFFPGPLRGGDYRFAIGTAGSCTLVLQTVLVALWFADAPSRIEVSGGTHNPSAPPADFLIRAWLPLVQRMGVELDLELRRHGFYPAGGGEIAATVRPLEPGRKLGALDLTERGKLQSLQATAVFAGIPADVGKRELDRVATGLAPDWEIGGRLRGLSGREGPGNALLLDIASERVVEVLCGFGEKGLPAERVADDLVRAARAYLRSTAAVDEHLADQLALPLALAGQGKFTTTRLSSHLKTNVDVIERFLPVEFELADMPGGGHSVTVR